MKNKKIIIMTVTLLAIALGIAFAFVMPQIMAGANADVDIISSTVDKLTFETGDDISLVINQFSLSPTSDDITSSTTAKASLIANNDNYLANYTYNLYFKINSNDYIYTTSDNKPEIILTITGPNGVVKSINGLTYNESLGGFDITTATGLIKVQENIPISSSSSTTATVQDWTFTIKFINLDSDQINNLGKSMDASVIIQQKKLIIPTGNFAEYIKETYGTDSTLLLHDSNLTNGAGDNSYRYSGASTSVDNYVCFGSDEDTCPTDNLYRIIGVFGDKVKLIKATSYGEYVFSIWSTTSYTNSPLYTELNTTYYNSLDDEWKKMISLENWISSEMRYSSTSTISMIPSSNYKVEFLAPDLSEPVYPDWETAKGWYTSEQAATYGIQTYFASMTISELRYSANESNWNSNTFDTTAWMFLGTKESLYIFYFITQGYGDTLSYSILANGTLYAASGLNAEFRPVFFLTADTLLLSGSGTSTDPYRIN